MDSVEKCKFVCNTAYIDRGKGTFIDYDDKQTPFLSTYEMAKLLQMSLTCQRRDWFKNRC